MNLKKFSVEAHDSASSNINTLPVMSLFVMLIPFLLMTTIFVETAVFELILPKEKKPESNIILSDKNNEKASKLSVLISAKGLQVGVGTKVSEYLNIVELKKYIEELKNRFNDRNGITLISKPDIKYKKIVAVMDILANNGFSEISIAGN